MPARCGQFFKAADALPPNSTEPLAVCRGCAIGARHAGVEPVPEVISRKRCVRCTNLTRKLIAGLICVSCYNRAREVARGKNARGGAPVRARQLRSYTCLTFDRRLRLKAVAGGAEGILSIDRMTNGAAIIAYAYPVPGISRL